MPLNCLGNYNKAFELLSAAEVKAKDVKDARLKHLLKALIYNSISNYYFKKKKYNACCTFAKDALKFWKKLGVVDYMFYFALKYATAAALSGKYVLHILFTLRFNDSFEQLHMVLTFADQDALRGRGTPLPVDVSFKIPSIQNEKLYFDESVILSALHNMAITQCALRKYNYGFATVERCLEFSKNYGITTGHAWLKQFHKTYEYASMQSQHPTFEQFRMKNEETHKKEIFDVSKKIEKFVKQSNAALRPLRSAPSNSYYVSQNGTPRGENFDATTKSLPQVESSKHKKLLQMFPFLKSQIYDIELKDETLLPEPKLAPVKAIPAWSEETDRKMAKLPPMKKQTKPKSQPVHVEAGKRKKLSPLKKKGEKRPKSVMLVDERSLKALNIIQCATRQWLAKRIVLKRKLICENLLEKDLIREQLEYEPLSIRSEDSYESEPTPRLDTTRIEALVKIQLFAKRVLARILVKEKRYAAEQDLLHEEAICSDEYEPPTPEFMEEAFHDSFE